MITNIENYLDNLSQKFIINNYFYNLPKDILIIIYNNLAALIIQTIFKNNRVLTIQNIGDRVLILINNKKKKYGTIYKKTNIFTSIKYLQQIIPNWKKSNILYWKCYKNIFPYYYPRILNIKYNNINIKIIKLHNWKSDLKINNEQRIKEYNLKNNII